MKPTYSYLALAIMHHLAFANSGGFAHKIISKVTDNVPQSHKTSLKESLADLLLLNPEPDHFSSQHDSNSFVRREHIELDEKDFNYNISAKCLVRLS